MSDNVQRKDVQLLRKDLQGLSKAISKLSGAIEKSHDRPGVELPEGVALDMDPDEVMVSMTAQAAVETLKQICIAAQDCDRGSCPIYDWCDQALPVNRTGLAPKYWPLPD